MAYVNGANDNPKGVATLIGSRTLSTRTAIVLATCATFAGSICTAFFAGALVKAFGGKGIVPDHLLEGALFPAALLAAAASTVYLATRMGMPVSTTHAMLGAMVGAAAAAQYSGINFALVGTSFAAPLVLSPAIATVLAGSLYIACRQVRRSSGISENSCVCVDSAEVALAPMPRVSATAATLQLTPAPQLRFGRAPECHDGLSPNALAISATGVLDFMHVLSGLSLSFARGLNDTAKIIGPIVLVSAVSPSLFSILAGAAMAAGGLFASRKVADTMSNKITDVNRGQGFIANAVSSSLVLLASRFGLPVSTTHVSCGSLFGIGAATGRGRSRTIGGILLAWATTLPVGIGLGMFFYWVGGALGVGA